MRVGLLGGSFNPPHQGHLRLARQARQALGLDEVLLVVAARPPHKPDDPELAPARDRLAMVQLAVQDEPALVACGLELERSGPSYTVDTLRQLQAERPQAELYFLVGGDSVGELPTWKDAGLLLRLARFVVIRRPGYDLGAGLAAVASALGEEAACDLESRVVPSEPDPTSSSEIRRRIATGEPWRGLVGPAVAQYIESRRLYRRSPVSETSSSSVPLATVRRLGEFVGQRVELRGWLYKLRGKGKIAFLHLRDGSGVVQAVLKKDVVGEDALAAVKSVGQEGSLKLWGTVRADERAPGGYELEGDQLEVVTPAQGEYPIALQKDQGIDHLLQHRHLWLRASKQHAVMRVRNEVIKTITDFFYERDYVRIDAPIFTPNAAEGTTTLFEVPYFEEGEFVYLSQSGQLYMEAGAMAHGKCYCFGPTFRAEKSKTRRHLTEFWMVEPEIAYATLDDVMDLAEDFLVAIVRRVLERCQRELETLERDPAPLQPVAEGGFPRITYDAAVELLHEQGIEFEWGNDLGAPDETAISSSFDKPVMVHRWPKDIKAFYMARDPEDDRLVLGVDVLGIEGVGELIGGGERATDLAWLESQIQTHGLPKEAFEWYLDLRRFGSVPHGGFGLGLERTVAWLCGREHIREAIPFPRTIYRKEP